MGKRGPASRPTPLKLLAGARPARINTDEPKPRTGRPQCPDEASDEVKAIWDYTLDQLIVMDIATPADRDALLCYCEAVVTHRKASAILAKTPVMVPGATKGTYVRNPAVSIQRDAAALIRSFAGEFGFTPSARSEIRQSGAGARGADAARFLSA